MSCMCGDTYCWSCGPAQGNYKCSVCGKWTEDGGCDDPETCAMVQRSEDDAYADDLEWLRQHEPEIKLAIRRTD